LLSRIIQHVHALALPPDVLLRLGPELDVFAFLGTMLLLTYINHHVVLICVLQVHADALLTYPALTAAAARLRRHLKAGWQRLDDLLEGVRAMTDWLNNTQLA
jgi:hypothetical protein